VNSGYYTNLPGATSQKICNAGYYCPPPSLQTQPASSQTQPASSQTQPDSSQRQQPDVPEYDNGKIYKVNDFVKKDGIVYKMIDGIGAPGYPPPRPNNWRQQYVNVPDYDNGKVYKLNDVVKKDGIVYRMIDGIGAAGYPPPRPNNWRAEHAVISQLEGFTSQAQHVDVPEYESRRYNLGEYVKRNGVIYKAILITSVYAVATPVPPHSTYWQVLQPPSPQTQSGATQRIPCAKGTYSVEYATACTACPQGTSTASTLSTSQSQCFAVYNSGSGSTVIPAQ
jgi:hypothetical protein